MGRVGGNQQNRWGGFSRSRSYRIGRRHRRLPYSALSDKEGKIWHSNTILLAQRARPWWRDSVVAGGKNRRAQSETEEIQEGAMPPRHGSSAVLRGGPAGTGDLLHLCESRDPRFPGSRRAIRHRQ